MLKITIELVPKGDTTVPVKNKWTMHIWNNATGTHSIGNYFFKIFRKNSTETVWKGGEVNNFQRLKWSVFYLLYLCLHKVYGENNDSKKSSAKQL